MTNEDKNTIETLKKLINEVKKEMNEKKIIVENKAPEQIFESHRKNMKDFVENKVWEAISNSNS